MANKKKKSGVDTIKDAVGAAKPAGGTRVVRTIGDGLEELNLALSKLLKNDVGNAERLIKRRGEDLLFVEKIGWLGYDGRRWSIDDGERIAQIAAAETAVAILTEANAVERAGAFDGEDNKDFLDRVDRMRKWGVASGRSERLKAMLGVAAPHITEKIDALDADHDLLNVENGTLVLGSDVDGGVELRKHSRRDRITKLSPVDYSADADCPRWHAFLARILPDPETRTFIQRFAGYTLTGSTSAQVVLLMHGGGANGKSTLFGALQRVMGDYAMTLPFASLLHDERKRGSEATPDIARLPGQRMVVAAEPEVGSRLSDSTIKSLTGGDKITARHLNQEFFEFWPSFKLWLSFNNRPRVSGQDDGIWRRLYLVPFEVQIPEAERDKNLLDTLWAERSGILNWMLDGWRMYRERGLAPPAQVRAATDQYRADSDPLAEFIAVAIESSAGLSTRAGELYAAYATFAKGGAQEPVTPTSFGKRLKDKGWHKERLSFGVIYRGVGLKPEFKPQPDDAPDGQM